MKVHYTYTIEHRDSEKEVLDITRKVFKGDALLTDSTVYGVTVIGHSGSFHQGHLSDLFAAKEREIHGTYKQYVLDSLESSYNLVII